MTAQPAADALRSRRTANAVLAALCVASLMCAGSAFGRQIATTKQNLILECRATLEQAPPALRTRLERALFLYELSLTTTTATINDRLRLRRALVEACRPPAATPPAPRAFWTAS
ncbi:hypothetical protein E4T66_17415 [Sinimarinibacterium sp. CAU 1509]|uniref:hypothetical protein n=1 Tax=Sinimarinibacterium sp. CAU 1509 TaxID=2562283 RepID=UPI0010AC9B16|nr:hypothetical protein [Sinimarinibacterium sp. CAU 1509]TJY57190.1 hypothetical protein E4T66_17415 [Sinimarinibacterium sp. CAU 1509]